MKKAFYLFSLLLLGIAFVGCSSSSGNSSEDENNIITSEEQPDKQPEPAVNISYNGDSAFSNVDLIIDISFSNFDSTPELVDVYTEDSPTPFASGKAVTSGKVTVMLPVRYLGETAKVYLKAAGVESNHISIKLNYIVDTTHFGEFVNSINTINTVKIKVIGKIRELNNTSSLTNENIRVSLDLSDMTEPYSYTYNHITYNIGPLFNNSVSLETIILPNEVNCIQAKAFQNCKNLREISMPDNVINIGFATSQDGYSFDGCGKLEKIQLPENLTVIVAHSFNKCNALKELTIPESCSVIGEMVFTSCNCLEKVTFINKSGWKVQKNSTESPLEISESELDDPKKAAKLLTSTHVYRYWTRSTD